MSGVISMSKFGRHGRWGNQVIQYAFLRTYARMHGLEVHIPPWVGDQLYGHADPNVSRQLPAKNERLRTEDNYRAQPYEPDGEEFVNSDFRGYAQYHTSWYRPHRVFVQSLFQPGRTTRQDMQPVLDSLRARGRTLVAVHVRRTDQGRFCFYRVPTEWRIALLRRLLPTLRDPVVFVASDEKESIGELAEFSPCQITDFMTSLDGSPKPHYEYLKRELHATPENLDFFPEFWVMQNADVVIGGNSTFSFSAAWLNTRLRQYWRADLVRRRFIEEDPWDTVPLIRDQCEEYKDIPGVCVEDNPWYQ